MTTPADTVSSAPPRSRQPFALCALVGVAVVVGWVVYRHYWLLDVVARVSRWSVVPNQLWGYTLVLALAMCLPYAVALLLWGRGPARASAGAGVAVLAGLVFWGIDYVFQDHIWASSRPSVTSIRIYEWGILLSLALLVPLAWGVARRQGRRWVLGLVVGPVVAAILRELQLRSFWWQQHVVYDRHAYHWVFEAVVFVAPFVLAVLGCWAIDEMTSSARVGARTPSQADDQTTGA